MGGAGVLQMGLECASRAAVRVWSAEVFKKPLNDGPWTGVPWRTFLHITYTPQSLSSTRKLARANEVELRV